MQLYKVLTKLDDRSIQLAEDQNLFDIVNFQIASSFLDGSFTVFLRSQSAPLCHFKPFYELGLQVRCQRTLQDGPSFNKTPALLILL